MTRYICSEKVLVDKVVEELYDFSKFGAVFFPDLLTECARRELLGGIQSAGFLFQKVQRERGPVIQEMDTLYFENNYDLLHTLPLLENAVTQLRQEYGELYEKIAVQAGFSGTQVNSVGVHHYSIGSVGITPHQDFKSDRNLIASFVIDGCAPFGVCNNREKTGAQLFDAGPGSLIFMRAARNECEQKYRPFHFLEGPLLEDRYSILLRCKAGGVNGY